MGADLGYAGSMWIATHEANAMEGYKDAIVEGTASDIVHSNLFTGVHGNYLRPSIAAAGLDPDNLPVSDPSKITWPGGKHGCQGLERHLGFRPGIEASMRARASRKKWTGWNANIWRPKPAFAANPAGTGSHPSPRR